MKFREFDYGEEIGAVFFDQSGGDSKSYRGLGFTEGRHDY